MESGDCQFKRTLKPEIMLRPLGVDPDAMPGRQSRLDVGVVELPHMQTLSLCDGPGASAVAFSVLYLFHDVELQTAKKYRL